MPLHLTRVAYGCTHVAELEARLRSRAAMVGADQPIGLTTRYKPKRWEETAFGSLYWIIAHQLVARSPLMGFSEAAEGRIDILIAPRMILVRPQGKRSHQGWRYLEERDAPPDLAADADTAGMPAQLVRELSDLGLV